MTISPKFSIGETVYLIVSREMPGMVTGIFLRPGNVIRYGVSFADETEERLCYDIELTNEKAFGSE